MSRTFANGLRHLHTSPMPPATFDAIPKELTPEFKGIQSLVEYMMQMFHLEKSTPRDGSAALGRGSVERRTSLPAAVASKRQKYPFGIWWSVAGSRALVKLPAEIYGFKHVTPLAASQRDDGYATWVPRVFLQTTRLDEGGQDRPVCSSGYIYICSLRGLVQCFVPPLPTWATQRSFPPTEMTCWLRTPLSRKHTERTPGAWTLNALNEAPAPVAGYLFRLFVEDNTSMHSYRISDEVTPRSRGLTVACSRVDSVPISGWEWEPQVVWFAWNFGHRFVLSHVGNNFSRSLLAPVYT